MDVRNEILAFSEIMEQKLKENDHKDHWSGMHIKTLLERLEMETSELSDDIYRKDDYNSDDIKYIQRECADVANFAMMIADNLKSLGLALKK